MGILDKLRKSQESAVNNSEEINALGWDAIKEEYERVYPNQKNSNHYGILVNWKQNINSLLY